MKEATGEANMTIVTVLLIAVVSGVAALLIPSIMTNVKNRSCCTSVGGTLKGQYCVGPNDEPLTSAMKTCVESSTKK